MAVLHRFYCILQSLNIGFILVNSADLDEMPHSVAFHLGLHCFPKYLFMGLCACNALSICYWPINLSKYQSPAEITAGVITLKDLNSYKIKVVPLP